MFFWCVNECKIFRKYIKKWVRNSKLSGNDFNYILRISRLRFPVLSLWSYCFALWQHKTHSNKLDSGVQIIGKCYTFIFLHYREPPALLSYSKAPWWLPPQFMVYLLLTSLFTHWPHEPRFSTLLTASINLDWQMIRSSLSTVVSTVKLGVIWKYI